MISCVSVIFLVVLSLFSPLHESLSCGYEVQKKYAQKGVVLLGEVQVSSFTKAKRKMGRQINERTGEW
jgi:hypothetical protein